MTDRRDLDNEPLPMAGDLGDLWSRMEERYQGYWDIIRRGQPMPEQAPLVPPRCRPRHFCPPPRFPGAPPSGRRYPPGAPPDAPVYPPRPPSDPTKPGIPTTGAPGMPMIDPRLADWFFSTFYDVLLTFKEDLKCGLFHVQKTWDPPQHAVRLDKIVGPERAVVVPIGGAPTDIATIETPDLAYSLITAIAQDPGGLATLQYRELRNNATLKDGVYNIQKRPLNNVSWDAEPFPIFLPPMSTFKLQAANTGAVPVAVQARISGYTVAIKDLTTDGSGGTFHVT